MLVGVSRRGAIHDKTLSKKTWSNQGGPSHTSLVKYCTNEQVVFSQWLHIGERTILKYCLHGLLHNLNTSGDRSELTGADPGFSLWGGGGGGRAQKIICANAHYEREIRSLGMFNAL